MSWKSWRKRAGQFISAMAALSLGAVAPAAATPPAAASQPKPALWKLADEDTTIYLFGTIHILPKNLAWRTPLLEKAIVDSDELVLETADAIDLTKTARVMMSLAISPGLPPLAERVSPEKRAGLEALIKSAGVPAKMLDGMETWAAAMMLTAMSFRTMGYNAEDGVERGLATLYGAEKKPVLGLETIEQQFEFFDTLPEESQRTFLEGAIEDPAASRATFTAMLHAWTSGDTDAIARTFDGEASLTPELREVLMKRRNAAWADWLARRLDKPGTVMVAVGAGHLAGQDSVQEMLAARGLKAERVQ
jgi:uncharacterized protein YbaP (TraB family)